MNWKTRLLYGLKIVAPLLLIAWLLAQLDRSQLEELRERPRDVPRLSTAFVLLLTGVVLSIFRWFLLVRALGLRFRLADAFRLGFLGYLLNFVAPGSVGGDLFKAVFVAREQPGRRTEAVATVFVDRLVGLFGLVMVTTIAISTLGLPDNAPELRVIRQITYTVAAVGVAGLVILLLPGFTSNPISEMLIRLPKVGGLFERVMTAVRMYRRRPLTLAAVGGLSLMIHALSAVAMFVLARGLFDRPPSLRDHFVIVPLANVAGSLPFTPLGLGTYEFAMDQLYELCSTSGVHASGLLVALAFRILTIGIAAVGVMVYWSSRREVTALWEEAESERAGAEEPPAPSHQQATACELPAT